jgi:ribosomal-protein-alanine N-acetyltransferase
MIEGRIDGHRAEIGYVLGRKFWNRGIMPDALKGIIQILFRDKAIERVWATHHVENVASGRVMAKAGMQCEGILRKYLLTPNLEPPARDAAIYSVTRESCRMDLPPEGS